MIFKTPVLILEAIEAKEGVNMLHWLQALLSDYGCGVVFLVVFLNNIGLTVPGDMMLVGAGFLVQKGTLSLWAVIATGTAACFLGGNCAYWVGLRFGPRLLKKIRWIQFTPERIKRVEHFFQKRGAKAVFFARFVALLHPVTGLLAGMGQTPWRPFLFYNLAGSAAYALLYTFAGTFFGKKWEALKTGAGHLAPYVLFFVLLVVLLFLGLLLWSFMRAFLNRVSVNKPTHKR